MPGTPSKSASPSSSKSAAEAEQEGDTAAPRSFTMANEVEKFHHALYSEALASLEQGVDLPQSGLGLRRLRPHRRFSKVQTTLASHRPGNPRGLLFFTFRSPQLDF